MSDLKFFWEEGWKRAIFNQFDKQLTKGFWILLLPWKWRHLKKMNDYYSKKNQYCHNRYKLAYRRNVHIHVGRMEELEKKGLGAWLKL